MGNLEATEGNYFNSKLINFAATDAGNTTQGVYRAHGGSSRSPVRPGRAAARRDQAGPSDRIIRDAACGEGTATVDASNAASYGSSSSRTWQSSSCDTTKAAPKVLTDRLQAERGKAAPATPSKAAPKVLALPGSSATEASTLEMDEDVVEGLEFASQFSPPFGTEKQYLGLEGAAPAEEVSEHPAPAHVEEEPGHPASPMAGEEAEDSASRGLKAAKSAARRLLEDLVREQERQETMEAPPVPAPPVPHMPYSALEGADGLLEPGANPGFRGAIQCGKECGQNETVEPSNNDTAGTASRTCPSSADPTSTTSRSGSRASRSFSTIPSYVDYAVSGSSGAPGSDGVSASCGTPDTDGAKAGSHDGQMDSSGHAGSHRGTEAGSHRGAEDGSHRSASSGSYDGTATFSDHGAAIFSKGGATACYNYGAQTLDIDDPCGTARGTKRDVIDGYGNCSDALVGGIWAATYANDGPTYATGGPTYANGEPIYAGNHGDDGSKDVTFNEG
ncbi:hypothetical protein AK812_SmicGene47271, partial [Symbiodinium microadriaticum]